MFDYNFYEKIDRTISEGLGDINAVDGEAYFYLLSEDEETKKEEERYIRCNYTCGIENYLSFEGEAIPIAA